MKIDRLVLRLPDDYAGRGEALSRAISSALAHYRPSQGQAVATMRAPAPAMTDASISETVVRSVAARIDKVSGRGRGGASS
jgi:hypothetical protein